MQAIRKHASHLLLKELLHLALEDKARGQRMLVLALHTVGALPEPAATAWKGTKGTYGGH